MMRFSAALIVACCILAPVIGVSLNLTPDPRQARGAVRSSDGAPAEDVDQILKAWEEHSSQVDSVHGTFKRTTCNFEVETEKNAMGRFLVQASDRWRIDINGDEPKKGSKSARTAKRTGEKLKLERDRSERRIRNQDQFFMVNVDDRKYERIQLEKMLSGKQLRSLTGNVRRSIVLDLLDCTILPFVYDMTVAETRSRFEVTLKSNSTSECGLLFTPRSADDLETCQKIYVVLDKQTFMPRAIKRLSAGGSIEVVYRLSDVTINDASSCFADADPLNPDLKKKGYKLPGEY